jgi:hypothetical protein
MLFEIRKYKNLIEKGNGETTSKNLLKNYEIINKYIFDKN